MWSDTVRYFFYSEELGKTLIPEPRNFKDGNGAKYKRDAKSKGILRKSSNTLEFIAEAYDYLLKINSLYGVVPDVRVDRWMKDETRLDQRWTYQGSYGIDITDMEFNHDQGTVKASYTDGGLVDKIQSRLNEVYDLIETTSVTGTDIGPLNTVQCSFPGKAIFLESKLEVGEGEDVQSPLSGGDRDGVRAIPFQVSINPDGQQLNNDTDNVNSITSPELGFNNGNFAAGSEGAIVYLNAERDRNLRLKGRVNFQQKPETYHFGFVQFGVLKYTNGFTLDFKEFTVLVAQNADGSEPNLDHSFDIQDFEVLEGESFTFAWRHNTDDGYGVIYGEGNFLNIIDEQPAPPSEARSVLFKEVFDRLMARAFGSSGLVKSELLETGEFAETLKTNGLFVRQFPDIVNEGTDEERRVQFKTSLKKQLESADCIHPVAYWVGLSEGREVLRIEKLKYTQQDFIGIRYADRLASGEYDHIPVQKVIRKVVAGNFYSSSQIGSTSTGDNYEDFFGLTSFCGNATYNFINDSKGVSYIKTTEDRTGDLDLEILRRKPFDKFPDEDTAMDDDILFIDAKRTGSKYTPRGWQDDFDEVPKNIYSPETAFNFRYSPANLLMNHSYVLNAGLQHHPTGTAKWASSNCNSSLITKLIGKPELPEGQPISHVRFERARIRPMYIDAETPVSLEIGKQINGFQPDGTPNWFGKVSVLIGQNIELTRLVEVDSNKRGKHKLIEST